MGISVHALDWGFDVLNRSAPGFSFSGNPETIGNPGRWRRRRLSAGISLACYSSP
jgi:hypothetical protein